MKVSLQTAVQKAFYTNPARFVRHGINSVPNEQDGTVPLPVRISWCKPATTHLVICADEAGSQVVRRIPVSGNTAEIYNLIPGERYWWQLENGVASGEIEIAFELPRWIHLPNLTNVRDLGGWQTPTGRIAFGKLYRGSQFEPWTNQPDGSPCTEEGQRVFAQELAIKTELDLRRTGKQTLVMPGVSYVKHGYSAYAPTENAPGNDIFTDETMTATREIFELLADKANYPIYFHCQGGGDRTGVLAFLIEIALGVSYEDVVTEYELSNLSVSGERSRFSPYWEAFLARLTAFGTTLAEQVHSYLILCGITQKQLDVIAEILIDK